MAKSALTLASAIAEEEFDAERVTPGTLAAWANRDVGALGEAGRARKAAGSDESAAGGTLAGSGSLPSRKSREERVLGAIDRSVAPVSRSGRSSISRRGGGGDRGTQGVDIIGSVTVGTMLGARALPE